MMDLKRIGKNLYSLGKKTAEISSEITKSVRESKINDLLANKKLPIKYDEIFPWSNAKVDNELTISDIIILWWYDEVNKGKDDYYPVYFERNYTNNFKLDRKKLIKKGYLNKNLYLTNKGKEALLENYKYVNMHRNSWMTDQDHEYLRNENIKSSFELAKYYEDTGDVAKSDEIINHIEETKKEQEIIELFNKAEKLSKESKIDESNEILLMLYDEDTTFSKPIVMRLAINYRKQKRLEDEVELLHDYLSKNEDKFSDDEHFLDEVRERYDKAKFLLKRKKLKEIT